MTTASQDDLINEGMAAPFDLADIEKALLGTREEREHALMRLVGGAYKRGWDECAATYNKALVSALPTDGSIH